jgi:urease beta subunit
VEGTLIGTVSIPPAFNIRTFAMGYSAGTDAGTCMICDVGTNRNVTLMHMAGKKYVVIYVCYLI